jgi:hypothetical protein
MVRASITKHGETTHRSKSVEYKTWQDMLARCRNPSHRQYHHYGGRGITVCSRWTRSFSNFLLDMGRRPDGCSINRVDNNGPYSKDNCQWSTKIEQVNNMRSNRVITFNGQTRTMAQWGRLLGINYGTLTKRFSRGMPVEKALAISRPTGSALTE